MVGYRFRHTPRYYRLNNVRYVHQINAQLVYLGLPDPHPFLKSLHQDRCFWHSRSLSQLLPFTPGPSQGGCPAHQTARHTHLYIQVPYA